MFKLIVLIFFFHISGKVLWGQPNQDLPVLQLQIVELRTRSDSRRLDPPEDLRLHDLGHGRPGLRAEPERRVGQTGRKQVSEKGRGGQIRGLLPVWNKFRVERRA